MTVSDIPDCSVSLNISWGGNKFESRQIFMLMFEYLLRGHCFSSHTVGVDGGGTGPWDYDGLTMTLMGLGQ